MTIEKGASWGRPAGPQIEIGFDAADDAELALAAAATPGLVATVASGDLHRTLGLPADGRDDRVVYPIDLGFVSIDDGPERPFVAHVVARRPWWLGDAAVVMNAAWVGDLYLGPRAHPNDGRLDVTVGRLPVRQLPEAASLARSGTHLPHPDLTTVRVAVWEHELDRPRPILVDGDRVGRGRRISVRIEPDALSVVG